jgi:hypothetical protein
VLCPSLPQLVLQHLTLDDSFLGLLNHIPITTPGPWQQEKEKGEKRKGSEVGRRKQQDFQELNSGSKASHTESALQSWDLSTEKILWEMFNNINDFF